MAVEARPINLFPSNPHFITNRDFIDPNTPTAPPLHSLTFPMYGKPDTGLISTPSRKRARCSVYDESPARLFDQEMIISHIEHQRSEIDRFIAIHTEKVMMEMEERKQRQSRMLVSAIEDRVVKKLKEKEEEIERMGKLNWVLQERVKHLSLENQQWRNLAETNEATLNSLRTNLEQVLMANAGEEAAAVADDAESSCGSSYSGGGGGRCRKCGAAESTVLVLPCRHLCLCTICGSRLHTCPVCNSAINASVHVNFS
ncbi:BOI-related E3 ubiquitin-protein ligase 1-like [Cucurbita pepo subsp. pepo]|uniref:BOI-related E3 ubiquitin-protein ligase 1-like n=1 Tax=Cucurbita pepo subsp. pepo TaxID=3664 RepID=UPI000C9D2796|nr:BOI-related E3 ubiquitin-protein ligase 1-like [Cucurbita pepo subsp. pepo]